MRRGPVRTFLKNLISEHAYSRLSRIKSTPGRIFQRAMYACGYVVAQTDDYYSPLPSRETLRATMPRWSRPSSLTGVGYDLQKMKDTLTELVAGYDDEFKSLLPYEEALEMGFGPGYTRLDARVLYSMLRTSKPARYVEVGSGLSTYYAHLAAGRNAAEGRAMEITCIEPYPFEALRTIPGIQVIQKEVQDVSLDFFKSLGDNDMLFIDSSHVVRLDGDVPFLFLEVLPALSTGALIHIHDIPFPYHFPYPPELWIYERPWPVWWNESMLLHALLCGNKTFEVTLSAPLIRYHDEPFLQGLISDYQNIEAQPNTFSSIWVKKCG